VWLGDGCERSASIICSYNDAEILRNIQADGIPVREWKSSNTSTGHYALGDGDRSQKARDQSWQAILRKNNLLNNKHIPSIYLRASYQQRISLLQGLMDSDGYCSKAGQCEFTTINKHLCDGVIEIIRSLGLKCTVHTKTAYLNGKNCGNKYRIQFWAYNHEPVFRLSRKYERQKQLEKITRNRRHFLKSIEKIASVPVRCIQVDTPSGLFLASRSFIPTHNSEFASGLALYLLVSDGEQAAQVYSAATDRDQAAIVFNGAKIMVEDSPELLARCRVLGGEHGAKRIIVPSTNSYYRVLSAESYSKHGYNISGLVVDEVHAHKDRRLIDVLTKGSGAARNQPLFVFITTAGTDRNSIGWELHEKALRVLKFRKPEEYAWVQGEPIDDPTFYAVIYGLHEDEDWTDEANWYKANPALGTILKIEDFRRDFGDAQRNVAEENLFKQLRLNIWVKSTLRWMKMDKWDECSGLLPGQTYKDWEKALEGRRAYAGLDLASSVDLAALALAIPKDNGHYALRMKFWIPEETAADKEQHDGVPYRQWAREGYITLTPGNVIDYAYILHELAELRTLYDFKELAYDRFGAWQLIQQLQEIGFITDPKLAEPGSPLIIPFGQGFVSMSGTTKEMMTFVLQGKVEHGGNPVLRWNADNMVVRTDPAGNIKPDKEKATQKIDGMVAAIMALDRAIRHKDEDGPSVYEERGVRII